MLRPPGGVVIPVYFRLRVHNHIISMITYYIILSVEKTYIAFTYIHTSWLMIWWSLYRFLLICWLVVSALWNCEIYVNGSVFWSFHYPSGLLFSTVSEKISAKTHFSPKYIYIIVTWVFYLYKVVWDKGKAQLVCIICITLTLLVSLRCVTTNNTNYLTVNHHDISCCDG